MPSESSFDGDTDESPDSMDDLMGHWPLTHATSWCGEWQSRHGEQSAPVEQSVSSLQLGIRCQQRFQALGIRTIDDLVGTTAEELLRAPDKLGRPNRHFGVASLEEVRRELRRLGLALRGEDI